MKIHYYKRIYLVKNRFPKFCPLYQEIPLLRDTLLREATVPLIVLVFGRNYYNIKAPQGSIISQVICSIWVIHLKYYFQRHVCVSIHQSVRPSVRPYVLVSEDQLQFLQANHKMLLIKVVPYVLGVDSWGPRCSRTQNVPRSGYFLVLTNADL